MHVVRHRAILRESDCDHVALGGTRGFIDCELRIACFAEAHAHAPLLVSDHNTNAKIETASASHHTRHAADAYEFLGEFTAGIATATAAATTSLPSGASPARAAVGLPAAPARATLRGAGHLLGSCLRDSHGRRIRCSFFHRCIVHNR